MINLLIATNVLIALGYYAVVAVIVGAPLKARWARGLGRLWLVGAIAAGIFFFGCGTHHIDMAYHLLLDPAFIDPDDIWHFLIVDAIQPVGALTVVGLAVFKGDTLIGHLIEALVRHSPEVIEHLAARLQQKRRA